MVDMGKNSIFRFELNFKLLRLFAKNNFCTNV